MEFLTKQNMNASIWKKLKNNGKVVIVNNNKPTALMLDLTNLDLEKTLKALDSAMTMNIFNSMREEAANRGFLTDEEIEEEISLAKMKIRQRELV